MYRIVYLLWLAMLIIPSSISACPVCEKQQPAFLKGITHGAGPQSQWDWIIIGIITIITLLSLVYSIKYLITPGEKNANHIKHTILSQ